jgi:CRISPR-associated protein Cas1
MAASLTVPQVSSRDNSSTPTRLVPRSGVLTLFGYGINIRLDRGHLVVEDGIGPHRRRARLPRVGHGLRRLIVIGSDGMVSLAAIRWLAEQKAAFVMLNRNGSVLVATGPVGPRDARLRRAQALALGTDVAISLNRELIEKKILGQERNVRNIFNDESAAGLIAKAREKLASASTVDDMRVMESQAALAYWSCWRKLPVLFPAADLPRVPEHWRSFGARDSPLTHSPRLSVNPPNAMLNYLYAVLESEARLAVTALGLDPGLGLMHMDAQARDSLACDLIEPIRPMVDEYVLRWLTQQPLRREWFFEERTGACRLMGRLAERLSETAPIWAHAIAPVAEHVVKQLWATTTKRKRQNDLATTLTQRRRREAKGQPLKSAPQTEAPPKVCHSCGGVVLTGKQVCAKCLAGQGRERMERIGAMGRIAAQSPKAQARRSATRRRNAAAERAWKPSDQPDWLTPDFYGNQVQPLLSGLTPKALMSALNVSNPYALDVRAGRRRPHPRHWRALAILVGVGDSENPIE